MLEKMLDMVVVSSLTGLCLWGLGKFTPVFADTSLWRFVLFGLSIYVIGYLLLKVYP